MNPRKILVYKPPSEPLPTFFPVFTDIENFHLKDLNQFVAKQYGDMKRGQRDVLKTVINTSTTDEAVVPYTYSSQSPEGLVIHEKRNKELKEAMKTARTLFTFAKENLGKQSPRYKRIRQKYFDEYGSHFKPDYMQTISNYYPIVVLESGWLVVQTDSKYPIEHIPTVIRIVAPGFRRYAEVGIDFMEKNKCCLCLLSPKFAKKEPCYHFFINSHNTNCPFVQ